MDGCARMVVKSLVPSRILLLQFQSLSSFRILLSWYHDLIYNIEEKKPITSARLTHPPNHPFSQNLASTFLSVSCNAHSLLALRLLTLSACARVNPFASTAALYPTHVLPSTSSSLTTSFVFPSARLYTVTTAAPPNPRLCCRATFAPGTRRLLAQPRSCQTSSAHCASPVAPSGWPLDMRPPEGFTTQRPP